MGKFLFGFFVAALVFNTDRTIELLGAAASVLDFGGDKVAEATNEISDRLVDELEKRGVLVPDEQ